MSETKPYSPEAEGELAKPTVECTREGTVADAAKAWEEAAFKQARRANGLRDKLVELRTEIDKALADDVTD